MSTSEKSTTNTQKAAYDALPDDPAALKRLVMQQREIIASLEQAKAARAAQDKIAAESPAAEFELTVFNVKGELEGLADGSGADGASYSERGAVCRNAIRLIDALFAAVPKQGA